MRLMMKLKQKYAALLKRTGPSDAGAVAGMRLCFELLTLAAAIDRDCAARLGAHGLSEGKFVLLFLLHDEEDGLSPHELAERAGVTRGTITGLLDGLERDGHLRRLSHGSDRRKLTVQLTPEGRRLARDLAETHSRWIASLFSGFSTEESALLSRLITNAHAHIGAGRTASDGGDDERRR